MSVMQAVRAHIAAIEPGEPFTTRGLLHLGSRAAIDQALSRLVREETLERLLPGMFVRPRFNAMLGITVPPGAEQILQVITAETGEVVQVAGAEAARRLGLSLQVPLGRLFETTGLSRTVNAGGVVLHFRHTAPRWLQLAGRPAGLAVSALRYLGPEGVTEAVLQLVARTLPVEEWTRMLTTPAAMPGWLWARLVHAEGIAHQHVN